MKNLTINVQIVRNIGNYETIRIGGEWSTDGESAEVCIMRAKREMDDVFNKMYKKVETPTSTSTPTPTPAPKKEMLTLIHPRFNGVCKALHEQKTDLKEVKLFFEISKEAMDYFKKHSLI